MKNYKPQAGDEIEVTLTVRVVEDGGWCICTYGPPGSIGVDMDLSFIDRLIKHSSSVHVTPRPVERFKIK